MLLFSCCSDIPECLNRLYRCLLYRIIEWLDLSIREKKVTDFFFHLLLFSTVKKKKM
uniref:Uncharacterized protein n=1 Tax=Anguilla anguilla TaxID=7936 RepID=A0A0E9WGQ6_ANGAN